MGLKGAGLNLNTETPNQHPGAGRGVLWEASSPGLLSAAQAAQVTPVGARNPRKGYRNRRPRRRASLRSSLHPTRRSSAAGLGVRSRDARREVGRRGVELD